jgi:hypothetical protein
VRILLLSSNGNSVSITGNASTRDASQGLGDVDDGLQQPSIVIPVERASYSDDFPSTPPSLPAGNNVPAIDPQLLDTPELNTSMMTQHSPLPQTPGAPGPSVQQDSPLSNVSDGETNAGTTRTAEIQSVKRKRQASKSNADRPRARTKRKATARA